MFDTLMRKFVKWLDPKLERFRPKKSTPKPAKYTPKSLEEFIEVIERRASIIPLDYPLVLEIHNTTFSSEEKIIIRIKNFTTQNALIMREFLFFYLYINYLQILQSSLNPKVNVIKRICHEYLLSPLRLNLNHNQCQFPLPFWVHQSYLKFEQPFCLMEFLGE